jgi:hypothetical protein
VNLKMPTLGLSLLVSAQCMPAQNGRENPLNTAREAYIAVTPTQKGKTVWLEPVGEQAYKALK